MATSAFTAQEGMVVVAADGTQLGRVAHIVRSVPHPGAFDSRSTSGIGVGDAPGLGDTGKFSPPLDTATWTGGEGGYVVVTHGGVLGIGATHLYIPFHAVSGVVPGENLTLGCSAQECQRLYGEKPPGL